MSSFGVQPNFDSFIGDAWGWGPEGPGPLWFAGFSNIAVGPNPPYTVTDFANVYPNFFGTPLQVINCTLIQGSQNIVMPEPTPGIAAGQLITGIGIPPGAVVQSYTQGQTNFTLSLPATVSASSVAINFYPAPFVPLVMIIAYIYLASASIMQARWFEMWPAAMAEYTAHFCTLYLLSKGNLANSYGQVAAAGISRGVTVSKGAGPVSQGIQPISSLDDWGSYALTSHGQTFATWARSLGAGVMMLW